MFRKVAILFSLAYVVLLPAGCQQPSEPQPPVNKPALPAEVAGIWQARGSPWRIVIDPNGTLVSAVIPMSVVEVRPNQTTKVEMKDGSWSTFKAGDCTVEYTPQTRELFVTIQMAEIHVAFLDNRIDGNSTDRFVGPVSEDGKMWKTEWVTVFDYGPRFPQEPNDVFAEPLIFDKVEK